MTTNLPNDADALKRLLVQRDAELVVLKLMVEKLKLQIARFKRDKFGASSERLSQLQQLELLVEELETERATIEQEPMVNASVMPAATERKQPVRKALPEHLPRETVTHPAACQCAGCGGALRFIGEDVSEVLVSWPPE